MEKRKICKENVIKGILIGFIIALVLFLIWANFIYFKNCESQFCFNDYLAGCSRARFIGEGNMTFEYKILLKDGDDCVVKVKLLRGDLSNQDSLALQSKSMKCNLPFGFVVAPEDDISKCHGLLKEGLQDLIIKKMHTYIVQNLEEINSGIF